MQSTPAAFLASLFGLSGRVAVVTGASSGLGWEMARALAEAGADVIAVARRRERLNALIEGCAGLAGTVCPCVADLSEAAGRAAAAAAVGERGNRLDILVANAGIAEGGPLEKMSEEVFDRVLDFNVTAQAMLAQALFEPMRQSGSASLINVASIFGLRPGNRKGLAAYAVSKHALIGLTRSQAVEWAVHGIRVNALAPGYFPSEMTEAVLSKEGLRRNIEERTLVGRVGRPEELITALLFLASPSSGYVTGVVLPVDGGWTAW